MAPPDATILHVWHGDYPGVMYYTNASNATEKEVVQGMATAAIGSSGRRALWLAIPYLVLLAVLAGGVFAIVNGIERYHKGIYAGFHYVDAKRTAINAMIVTYGYDFVNKSTFAHPPVVNTHQYGLLNSGQVRIFHIYGPRGTRYCVSVWNPGDNWTDNNKINIGGDYNIVKNCHFK